MEQTQAAPPQRKDMKIVYVVTERAGRSFWTRVGTGFVNRDGSVNLRLDAIPISGNLQVRDYEPRDADRASDPDIPFTARARTARASGDTVEAPF